MKTICATALSALLLSAAADVARASLVTTGTPSGSQTAFDGNILANDLVENGSLALSGVTTTGSVSTYMGDVAPYNSFSNLTDGAASTKVSNNDISHDTYFDSGSYATGPSVTYSFNNPLGETLTRINSISGWADTQSFSHQDYTVSVSFVGSPSTFVQLASVNYDPWNGGNSGDPNSTQMTLTDTTGALASGVAAIKFAFVDNGGSGQVFREIDVVGRPTPEPASVVLFALGATGLFAVARRRRSG